MRTQEYADEKSGQGCRTIPAGLGAASMADAFRFYRDDLGWQVYPVDGVWSSKPDPGKKPSIKEWWNYDPHDCDVAKYFGNNGHCHNIGFAPRSSVVVVDLDSKADQGESVWHFLSDTPALEKVPRHRTHGGVHLLFWCPDLPRWKKRNGCLYHDTLNSQINKKVSAELFHSDHSNVVFPPSVHPSGGVYKWETFGEIPAATWKRLQKTFGFRPPEDRAGKKEESEEKWHLKYEGDLSSLDLIALLEELGWPATLCGADEGKYSISCPWETEHMAKTKVAGTSTVVWPAGGDAWPQFRCLHSHCSPRGIKDLLAWAEEKSPGVVDKHCSRLRIWKPGQVEEDGRVRVAWSAVQLQSDRHSELAAIFAPKNVWFRRGTKSIVTIDQVAADFHYAPNPAEKFKAPATTTGLCALSAHAMKSEVERYVIPGNVRCDKHGRLEFTPNSFPTDFCVGLGASMQFRNHLPEIDRILTVPLPFFDEQEGLMYPKPGYDPRFKTYLLPGAPVVTPMSLKESIEVLRGIHSEFCFSDGTGGQRFRPRHRATAHFLCPADHRGADPNSFMGLLCEPPRVWEGFSRNARSHHFHRAGG